MLRPMVRIGSCQLAGQTSSCTVTDKEAEPAIAVSGGRMKKRSCRTGKTIIGEAEAKLKDEAYAKSLSLKSAHPIKKTFKNRMTI